MFEYMTAQEAAEKWNVSLRWVQRLCKGNRIEGVMNINRVWLIPKKCCPTDDYIVKPFSLVELEARVQAHLRREERHQTNTKVKFSGELLIDYSERTVYIQNQPIGLVKKEFDIVELLSQNAGQVFDKERIYERVWGYDSEGDSSVVAEHIRRIRTKIAAYTNKSYIETVWGCGYKWIR